MHRVLVSGDRHWNNPVKVRDEIKKLIEDHGINGFIVIGGGAPGLDTMCRVICHDLNVHFAEVKALWNTRHVSAGPQRNKAMLGLEPHELIAFHSDIKKSKGTKDMIKQAVKAGIKYRLVT